VAPQPVPEPPDYWSQYRHLQIKLCVRTTTFCTAASFCGCDWCSEEHHIIWTNCTASTVQFALLSGVTRDATVQCGRLCSREKAGDIYSCEKSFTFMIL
jgi:hypothetical protein